jgi:methylglutaconyl-CoA hydratase
MQMGLINSVVSPDKVEHEVGELAKKLVESNSSQSMKLTKQMISKVQSLSVEDALHYAAEMNAHARGTDDCKRGIAAFLSKEKIRW